MNAKELKAFQKKLSGSGINFQAAMSDSYFDGASTTAPALLRFNPPNASADARVEYDREILTARGISSGDNHPLTSAITHQMVMGICGTGLTPVPTINHKMLGITYDEAADLEWDLIRLWHEYAESGEFSVRRSQTFKQQQSIISFAIANQGDCFALKKIIKRPGSRWSTRWQLISGARVSNPGNGIDSKKLIGGIQKDSHGAPIYFHIRNDHPGGHTVGSDSWVWSAVKVFGEKTGRRNILHAYNPHEDIGQTRGIPMIHRVVGHALQHARYTDAELSRAVTQSRQAQTITSDAPELMDYTPAEQKVRQEKGHDGFIKYLYADRAISTEEGTINIMPAGHAYHNPQPTAPNTGYDAFMTAGYAISGASVGMPGEVAFMRHPSSYSASRAALNSAGRTYAFRRYNTLATQICPYQYDSWLDETVALGLIRFPWYGRFENNSAWLRVDWQEPPETPLDEMKAANAAAKRIEAGISTEKIEARKNGLRWNEITEQRQREWEARAKFTEKTDGV